MSLHASYTGLPIGGAQGGGSQCMLLALADNSFVCYSPWGLLITGRQNPRNGTEEETKREDQTGGPEEGSVGLQLQFQDDGNGQHDLAE